MTRQRAYEAAVHEQAQAQAEYDLLKAGAWKPDLEIAKAAVERGACPGRTGEDRDRPGDRRRAGGRGRAAGQRPRRRARQRPGRQGPGGAGRHQHLPRPRRHRRARHRALPTRGTGQGLPARRDGSRDDDALRARRAVRRARRSRSRARTRSGSIRGCSRCFTRSSGPSIRSTSASSWTCSSTGQASPPVDRWRRSDAPDHHPSMTLDSLTFQLEGKLAGPWVHEAEDCWRRTLARATARPPFAST